MAERAVPVLPHARAYSRLRRVKDAYRFIQQRADPIPEMKNVRWEKFLELLQ